MKNKGFTLIEVLGVIAVLGLIAMVAMPNIIDSLKKTDENKQKAYQNSILQGTEIYVEQNRDLFKVRIGKGPGTYFLIKIYDAVATGYVQSTLTNSATGTTADKDNGCVKISINSNKSLSYDYISATGSGADTTACLTVRTVIDQ